MCVDCACGLAGPGRSPKAGLNVSQKASSSPGLQPPAARSQALSLGLRLLAHNDRQAEANRVRFAAAGLVAVNLLSSPGSGKTALLEALARHNAAAAKPVALAALVGDLATDLDAARLRAAGLAAAPITTGQACHLDAAMVDRGLDALEAGGLDLAQLDLLLIENVGNLVCPAAYDLGEQQRLVLLAVGEGEDKPLKYPATFASADLVVISKVDLAEAVGFERERALANIGAVAPRARTVELSARSGAGLVELMALLG